MQDVSLYQQILGLSEPWFVTSVKLDIPNQRVDVFVEHREGIRFACPVCGKAYPLYDHAEERQWRHLDTCQLKTYLHARIPRVACPQDGIRNAQLPWGERGSRFTLMMECLIIDVLQQCTSVTGAARLLHLSWEECRGVMVRAVARGRLRRRPERIEYLCVDEKGFRRGHHYLTIVSDLERSAVLEVGEGRTAAALADIYSRFAPEQLDAVQAIAMDMCRPYVKATRQAFLNSRDKIVFDRFHVMQKINQAVDRVRRQELAASGSRQRELLKGSKQLWLWAEERVPQRHQDRFAQLKQADLQTSRAWALKENLRHLWTLGDVACAMAHLKQWLQWAKESALCPLKAVIRSYSQHMAYIINYARHPITTSTAEGINSRIQSIKHKAAGFRNLDNFITAIYFYCGKLDLYPR